MRTSDNFRKVHGYSETNTGKMFQGSSEVFQMPDRTQAQTMATNSKSFEEIKEKAGEHFNDSAENTTIDHTVISV